MTGSNETPVDSLFIRICRSFLPYRKELATTSVAIIVSALFGTLNPLLAGKIIDDGILNKDYQLVVRLVGALLLLLGISGLLSVGQSYLSVTVGQAIMRDFRVMLYKHLQLMSLKFYGSQRLGERLSRLSNDVNSTQTVVTTLFSIVLANIFTILITLAVMLELNILLTFISILIIPCFLYPIYKLGKVRKRISANTQEALSALTSLLETTLSVGGALLIRSFGRQEEELAKLRLLSNRVMRLQIHQTMVGRWFYFGFHLFFSAAPALVYFVGGWQAISGSLTIGNLVAFIALQTRLFTPFKDLLDAYGEVQAALAVFERLYSYAELPVDVQERSDAIMLQKCTGLVSFNDVHFSYTQHGQTLTALIVRYI